MGKLTLEEVLTKTAAQLRFDYAIKPKNTALLLIDMQEFAGTSRLLEEAVEAGLPEKDAKDALMDHEARVKAVLVNGRKILKACRKKGIVPIHVKVEALSKDARDTGRLYRTVGFIVPRGSKWAKIFDEVAPEEGEIVLTKTHSSAFIGTNLDRVLRNMEIENLIVIGFNTDWCVEAAYQSGADYGYNCLLVEDACTTLTRKAHDYTIAKYKARQRPIRTTEEVLKMIETCQ
nr:isochorismatase family cysteine hydrolase [Candidatus Njordarchaeum guaymaensis]